MAPLRDMLSSKELIERTAISRSTLNNYISLGLLPKPVVRPATGKDGRAPRIGYFPKQSLAALKRVAGLKQKGHSMAEIADMMATAGTAARAAARSETRAAAQRPAVEPPEAPPLPAAPASDAELGPLPSITDVCHPAYMVSNTFAVTWANRAAEREIFGRPDGLPDDPGERSLFRLFSSARQRRDASWQAPLRFHVAIAKRRLSKAALLSTAVGGDAEAAIELGRLYDEVEPAAPRPLFHAEVDLVTEPEGSRRWDLFATVFREGVLFAYVPRAEPSYGLLNILSRRELAIRDLMLDLRPYLTPLAVLVAELRDAAKIRAELAADEYFELINQVWAATAPLLRKHRGTAGQHAGDGFACFFFPQPDRHYIINALRCAHEANVLTRQLSHAWQARKNWDNDLGLNVGIDEGEAWVGSCRTPAHLELTALGEAVERSARLSGFARDGSVWVTKNLLGKLPARMRAGVRYGIRRRSGTGETMIVESSFARLSSLIDPGDARMGAFQDIAALPVTQVLDVRAEASDPDG